MAIARATVREGTGKVYVNNTALDAFSNEYLKMKLMEPLYLSKDIYKKYDFDVVVTGGGQNGQIEAARMAIARALVQLSKSKELEKKFVAYDRNMLVYDPRRNEPSKPSRSSDGARRKKQLSKR